MARHSRWRRVRRACAALCIAGGLALVGVEVRAGQITAHGRPRALWRASLPGLDLGLDASPARPGRDGAVELWAEPHDADDSLLLLRLLGAPALPRPLLPGEVRAEPYPAHPPARSNRRMRPASSILERPPRRE